MPRRSWGCALADAPASGLAIGVAAAAVPIDEDPVRLARLRRHQLELLQRQATRSFFGIAISAAVIAYVVADRAPWYWVVLWGLLQILLPFARRAYALRQLSHPPADVQRALDRMVVYGFAAGLVTGSAAPLFFPVMHPEGRALLTMILVCWTAGGVTTAAAYARVFYAYVASALLPLAFLWVMAGDPQSIAVAVLIVLFGLMQLFFVRDNERVVRESFAIRYENERLLEALERERQEVLLARDRAEEANRAKSQFLAAASHDLRQPLHALSLFSATLTLRAADSTTGEIASHIDKALASLSTLVDSVLDISKLDAGAVRPELQRVNMKELIERIAADYRPVAREKGLAFGVAPVDAQVETDPVLLERIVRNLVDNAFKYTAAGSVSLDVRTRRAHGAHCGARHRCGHSRSRARAHIRGVLPGRQSGARPRQGAGAGAGDRAPAGAPARSGSPARESSRARFDLRLDAATRDCGKRPAAAARVPGGRCGRARRHHGAGG